MRRPFVVPAFKKTGLVIVIKENLDTHPKALVQAAPIYPLELKRKRIKGFVSLVYIVSDNEVARNIRITEATNRSLLIPS